MLITNNSMPEVKRAAAVFFPCDILNECKEPSSSYVQNPGIELHRDNGHSSLDCTLGYHGCARVREKAKQLGIIHRYPV
jgi:hypothetical protein